LTPEALYLGCVLACALVLFYTGWLRTDVTALLVMLSLMVPWRPGSEGELSSILTAQQAFSGFGSPALIMVASMFVLSEAMVRTGGAQLLGGAILDAGARSEIWLQITVLTVVTLFSSVINDTTTVLIWMPVILAVCRQKGHSPSRILLPLAYASLLGGQWTLIGTRSNIVVSDYLHQRTGQGLGFFEFTPIAVAVWIGTMCYFLLIGRRHLPSTEAQPSLAERYEVTEYLTEIMAAPGSALTGRTLGELDLPGRHDVTVLAIIRGGEHLPPSPWLKLYEGDVFVVQGVISKITEMLQRPDFQVREELKVGDKTLRSVDLRMVEALVAPNSDLEGTTLERLDFHHRYGLSVLAIGRQGRPLHGRPLEQELRFGDSLLLVGHEQEIRRLRWNPNFLLLESRTLPVVGRVKPLLTVGLMVMIAVCAATKLLAPAVVIPLAAMIAVLAGCVGMRQAYEAIDWMAIVVVGAMIPYGVALEETGTARLLAASVTEVFRPFGSQALFAAVLFVTVALTQLIENAAVAIIFSPVALELALSAGANPKPFLLGIAICVSSAFMTPVAHESTILVMGPGRYEFRHYLKLGTPFALLTWLITTLLLPLIYPLH
jgi:di/tricarboxylate transporter